MPLVSGVCRAASAPMLSHGGSRLNASKPEANPKTSCPFLNKNNFEKESGPFFCLDVSFLFSEIYLKHSVWNEIAAFYG